jgi:hypothetical protein
LHADLCTYELEFKKLFVTWRTQNVFWNLSLNKYRLIGTYVKQLEDFVLRWGFKIWRFSSNIELISGFVGLQFSRKLGYRSKYQLISLIFQFLENAGSRSNILSEHIVFNRDEKRNLRFPCIQWKRKRNFVPVSTVYKGNANFVSRPWYSTSFRTVSNSGKHTWTKNPIEKMAIIGTNSKNILD